MGGDIGNILDIDYEVLDELYVSKKAKYYDPLTGEYIPRTVGEEIRRFKKRG